MLSSGSQDISAKQNQMKKVGLRAGTTQRRIRDLSVSMHMKEELIKELEKTGVFLWFSAVCTCSPECLVSARATQKLLPAALG